MPTKTKQKQNKPKKPAKKPAKKAKKPKDEPCWFTHLFYKNGKLVGEAEEAYPIKYQDEMLEMSRLREQGEKWRNEAIMYPDSAGYVLRMKQGNHDVPIDWEGTAPEQFWQSENLDGSITHEPYGLERFLNMRIYREAGYSPRETATSKDAWIEQDYQEAKKYDC